MIKVWGDFCFQRKRWVQLAGQVWLAGPSLGMREDSMSGTNAGARASVNHNVTLT